MKFDKMLALSPHPDDVEFGCGGLIHKLLEEGSKVHVANFSFCEESVPEGFPENILQEEMHESLKTVGIEKENIHEYSFPVRHFPQYRQDILEILVKLNKNLNPDMVLTPSSFDVHQDHNTIYQECLRAFRYKSIFGYELPWNNITFTTTGLFEISEENLNRKITALKCYKSQQFRHYSNENFVRSLAALRGGQNKTQFAEAFEVIRLSG
jgi:LmbE family N-acetylglucosaminyl deacetylase